MLAGRDGSVVGLASGTHGLGQGSTTRRCWSHRRGGETPPSPVTPTCPTGYAAKGASPALPLLDDAHGHRRRRGALDLRPWRRNQTHHTSITTCWGIVDEAQRRYRPQLPVCPQDGGEIGPSAALLLLQDGQTSSRRRAWHPDPFRHHDMQRSSVTGHFYEKA